MAGVAGELPDSLPVTAGAFSRLAQAQYAALARMRWSMFRNSLRSTKGAFELGARVITTIVFSLMGLGIGTGIGVGSYFMVANGKLELLPIIFWAVFLLWQIVPISMASFQEQFDTNGLLRFPVSFGAFYLLHLVFGLVDASTIAGGFCCLGVGIGVSLARPDLAGWIAISLVVFAAFNVLLVRAIFTWIDRWLAQRRTREIVMAIFFLGILGLNLVNPIIQRETRKGRFNPQNEATALRRLHTIDHVQRWLPPGLAAYAVQNAENVKPLQGMESLAILGVFTLAAGATLGARLRAEYRGENLGDAPARKKEARRTSRQWLIDGSGPIAAVLEKELRTLLRAMPLLYAIATPLLMVFVFSSMPHGRRAISIHLPVGLMLCVAYAFVGFTQLFYNNLGGEGPGIQLLFMSPTPIRTVILGKNIFHAVLFGVDALLVGVVGYFRFGGATPEALAVILAWVLFALPLHLAVGDVFSLTMAYRINLGRISRQKGSQANALLSMLVQAGALGVGALVVALCSFAGELWVAIPIFLSMGGIAVMAWTRVLDNVNRMASERREELIATLAKTE